LKEEAAGR